jgi:hypothetical protein
LERTGNDHAGQNNGGARKATTTLVSLDDESNKSCNFIAKSLVEEENPFSFYDGYQNLQRSTTQHGKLHQYEFF